MRTFDTEQVLDHDQLRDVTMDDPEMMREILAVLLEDTTQQIVQIEAAIVEKDSARCRQLAHYSKGACANIGANAAAATLREMEMLALNGEFEGCSRSLAALAAQVERLKVEITLL